MKGEIMPRITVITPVYKAEQYLDKCVESILAQTFTDFELILVDDGSPDKCPQICDKWAKMDRRIRVIHQENQGQAVARNNALDIAVGEYISFVDSDDYIHPQCLEILLANAEQNEAEVSVCSFKRASENKDFDLPKREVTLYEGKEYVRKKLSDVTSHGVWLLCDKLFKKKCWENIRLPVGRINEDNATVYKILYECSRVALCEDVLYYYLYNEESTTKQNFNKKHLDWLLVPQEMIEYFTEKGDQVLIDKSHKMYLSALENMYNKVRKYLDDKPLEKELRMKLIKQLKIEKQKYPITVKSHPSLYETLYPNAMKLYWSMKGILNKFKR